MERAEEMPVVRSAPMTYTWAQSKGLLCSLLLQNSLFAMPLSCFGTVVVIANFIRSVS